MTTRERVYRIIDRLPDGELEKLENELLSKFGELRATSPDEWRYLEERPHPWMRQLFVKGRRLRASTVLMYMLVNELSREEIADSYDLPLDAVDEIIRYCDSYDDLLDREAEEEKRILIAEGVALEPTIAHR